VDRKLTVYSDDRGTMSIVRRHPSPLRCAAPSSKLSQAAIIALITQPTVAEAARVANVRPNTLGRWKKEPAFSAGSLDASAKLHASSIQTTHI
jgi:hypothetical protein